MSKFKTLTISSVGEIVEEMEPSCRASRDFHSGKQFGKLKC